MTKEQKILLLFVLLIAGSGTAFYVSKSGTPVTPAATQTSQGAAPVTTQPTTANTGTSVSGTVTGVTPTAQNKTIVETITYQTPEESQENVTVTAVVDASGNIVDVTFAYGTPHKIESKEYLGKFVAALPTAKTTLIGTKIGSQQLSRVGGASLTTAAFNKALSALATKVTG